ncbi:zinc finger CCCH domain-containing protein 3 [Condylostylus longicornis]|uniref:zinc finger CCCH domain-containing protein 3 n=1 Tax=Condylostylus longicornis TaxID=2530218 RepID=UPI00244E5212|nr:zinc finger CCCH domain-containing protein 3 [Condylostylus longicornis]
MLPSSSRGTVYINPNFKTTHINPKFLRNGVPNSIHINPAFLEKQQTELSEDCNADSLPFEETLSNHTDNIILKSSKNSQDYVKNTEAKIIPKSRTKLIRKSNNTATADKLKISVANTESSGKLLKIGLRKLIRSEIKEKPVIVINNFSKQNLQKLNLKSKSVDISSAIKLKDSTQKYKIDRRIIIKPSKFLNVIKKKSFVSQFALCRNNMKLTPKKVAIAQDNIFKKILPKGNNILSANLKLELLNINGVLYKSTRTKLQRSTANEKRSVDSQKPYSNVGKESNGDRVLFVRGNKFVLDKSGLKLTKIQPKDIAIEQGNILRNKMKRIDIGGLTYVAKSNNVFIRTDRHVTRNYISTTKQRSINTLHNRMVKTNIPCPIYRKIGRCGSFEKGKCPKVHEKEHVAICSKFLKGECTNVNCLLSHNVNFSKMPVCKFFLQGCCVKEDCPYLHRKMGKSVEICSEFLKGFCILAEKCSKRHEFLCPDYESKGKCEKIKCMFCKKRVKENIVKGVKSIRNEKEEKIIKLEEKESEEISKNSELGRYFIEQNEKRNTSCPNLDYKTGSYESSLSCSDVSDTEKEEDVETKGLKRPKLGILPAYIPL